MFKGEFRAVAGFGGFSVEMPEKASVQVDGGFENAAFLAQIGAASLAEERGHLREKIQMAGLGEGRPAQHPIVGIRVGRDPETRSELRKIGDA